MQVATTQTDRMMSFILSLPDAVARELVHQVLAYAGFLDQVDALDRYVDKAWSVARDVDAHLMEPFNFLFATLSEWTDGFRHMLTVPNMIELPSLFQSPPSCPLPAATVGLHPSVFL